MPDLSLVKFDADMEAFAKLLDIKIDTVVQKITADVWARITGNFEARAAWGMSVGNPAPPTPPPAVDQREFYGPPSAPNFGSLKGDKIVYILNALPYIEALEDGHSGQAPNGFVRLAILEVEAEIDAIVALNQ
jgi:hypothetical protein